MTRMIRTTPMKPALMRLIRGISALVFRAPPRLLSDTRELHGTAFKVAGAERDPADVVGEEGTVGADSCELAIELGRTLKRGVKSVPVRIEQWGEPVQLVDRAGQWRPRPTEQVGQRCRSVVQRLDSGADRIAVIGQPVDQLLQPVDR